MILQVNHTDPSDENWWFTIRTSIAKGIDGYKELNLERSRWAHNGDPKYASAKFRIGAYVFKEGERIFEEYIVPKSILEPSATATAPF